MLGVCDQKRNFQLKRNVIHRINCNLSLPYCQVKSLEEFCPEPAKCTRSTKDIDIFWLDDDGLQRAYAPLHESTQVIKQKHDLDADWLNYLAQMLMYDEVIVPDGKLWKRFGPLHVLCPSK